MARVGPVGLMVLVVAIAGTSGCQDSGGPRQTLSTLAGLVVSAPVQQIVAAPITPARSASAGVVYVSLAPGSVPTGNETTIRDRASGEVVTASLVGGGFDPVGLQARVGDTLELTITLSGSGEPLIADQVVSATRPPVVVRTDPAPKKVDVPLNASLVVVFSEPIDSVSLNPRGVYLLRDTIPVAGQLEFLDPAHLSVAFTPAADLAAQTIYTLTVSPVITGSDGLPLEAAFEAEFTTGSSTTGIASVSVVPETVTASFGSLVQLNAVLRDDQGTVLRDQGITWASSAESLAAVSAGGLVTTQAPGNVIISATAGGKVGTASITVGPFFTEISTGTQHTCGITSAGRAYCWGDNTYGQLGDGTITNRTTPVAVAGGLTFGQLIAGGSRTCGLNSSIGVWYCWGSNDHGQLGDGTTTDRTSPVPMTSAIRFNHLTLGTSHTCGVELYSYYIYCWGLNDHGQLGDPGVGDQTIPTRVAVGGGAQLSAVSAGGGHTCGADEDMGWDYCWGANSHGQLGDGTTTDRAIPVLVTAVPCGSMCPNGATVPFDGFTTGASHTCARVSGFYSSLFLWACWGANADGQLGDGTTIDRTTWSLVGGAEPFISMSAGGRHTCATAGPVVAGQVTARDVYCWGSNADGQLGDGTNTQRTKPVLVSGGLTFLAVSVGGSHTCGVTATGVYCWGSNSAGQLGTGTTTSSNVPVKVAGQP